MKFNFSKLKVKGVPNCDYVFRPFVDINLINGTRVFTTKALIDSGADNVLVNIGIAKSLNIKPKEGIKAQTTGVGNIAVPIYYHNLEMEIPNFENSRIPIQIGFIDSGSVGVLLGRYTFFDKFKISFELYNNCFDISLP